MPKHFGCVVSNVWVWLIWI